jgi:hypothetical protein
MGFSIANELRRTFDLATARKDAEAITAPHQWAKVRKVRERCDRARGREELQYKAHYQTRVETARRQIVKEAGRKKRNLDHPWFPNDRFSIEDTLRQAQRIVRAQHDARIARIDAFELRELKAITQSCLRENSLRGTARYAFIKATDRRSGDERRRSVGPVRS